MELPPRARRIPTRPIATQPPPGTTSACAENTVTHRGTAQASGNYLRVRGEYWCDAPRAGTYPELPPRARRIRLSPLPPDPRVGTTSACAENTSKRTTDARIYWNYLRVRGEYEQKNHGR